MAAIPDPRLALNRDSLMETVRSGSLFILPQAGPSVYAVVTCASVHAILADVWRRDRSLFVQYALRRRNSIPALALATARPGRGRR